MHLHNFLQEPTASTVQNQWIWFAVSVTCTVYIRRNR